MPLSSIPGGNRDIALVLGGGNALGAYLAGAYEELHEQGVRPGWIIGASVGAITGAILAGNAPEDRNAKLARFWEEATLPTSRMPLFPGAKPRQIYNGMNAALAAMFGRPNIFRHRYPGLWSALPWVPNDIALYDTAPLRATLERLVDFDRLNGGEVRFTAACVDLETGDEVYFDTARDRIGPEHILASTAITPLFPPVEIGGRLLCDPGYTNNLPLDYPFREPLRRDLTVVAVDLFSLRSPRPASLDAVLERTQDIVFASATRRSVAALRREFALMERQDPDGPSARLLHLAYQAAAHELAVKTLDFSPGSVRDRRAAGRRDMESGLASLRNGPAPKGRYDYVPVDSDDARAAAEAGADGDGAAPLPLGKVA
ncbi:patatin-like phospholipase family protein [Skermanella pratensis]|uniref:patatin-like phospholipase family protein n=1 Tax=Skermanella pratensis TaxID=2233999 RepID=UPI001301596F|nr:patatin-like phospholipase family protein [Skermanella pratensis]